MADMTAVDVAIDCAFKVDSTRSAGAQISQGIMQASSYYNKTAKTPEECAVVADSIAKGLRILSNITQAPAQDQARTPIRPVVLQNSNKVTPNDLTKHNIIDHAMKQAQNDVSKTIVGGVLYVLNATEAKEGPMGRSLGGLVGVFKAEAEHYEGKARGERAVAEARRAEAEGERDAEQAKEDDVRMRSD